MIFTWRFF